MATMVIGGRQRNRCGIMTHGPAGFGTKMIHVVTDQMKEDIIGKEERYFNKIRLAEVLT